MGIDSAFVLNLSFEGKSSGFVLGLPDRARSSRAVCCEGFWGDGQELLMVLISRCWEELGEPWIPQGFSFHSLALWDSSRLSFLLCL